MKNFSSIKRLPALVALALTTVSVCVVVSCESVSRVPDAPEQPSRVLPVPSASLEATPEGVARMLSEIPFGIEQAREVWSAVNSSISNGYDEEYLFSAMLDSPGSGVGDITLQRASAAEVSKPMSFLLSEYAESRAPSTRSSGFLESLKLSGLQIYWPYSEDWDGVTMPALTFNAEDGQETGTGFRRVQRGDGSISVETFVIDEEYAEKHPVWVVNRNEDSGYLTPEMIERVIPENSFTRAASSDVKTLKLKDFKAHRNYDSWFAGASEFVIKCGSVENFKAATTDELKLYHTSLTDLVLVVKRKQVGKYVRLNSVLVSEWTGQLDECAFMMIEDDGGTSTTWKCNATVKIKSKSYGVEIEFPLNRSDDIVWRGKLSKAYLDKNNGTAVRLGDVSVVFTIE